MGVMKEGIDGVHVLLTHYSCSTGFGRYYKGLRDFLNSQVGDQIELIPKEDRGITGNFEVTVLETGKLLHSTMKMGQGKATSNAERMVILDQIQELLDE